MIRSCLLLALPAVSLAAQQAQIYLSPRPFEGSALSTSARDANALLSSHLGIAEYENAPAKEHWTALGLPLADDHAPWQQQHSDSLIIMVESSGQAEDYLPTSLASSGPTLLISSPPSPDAFDALISVYLRRIARTFGLHLADIRGIEAFAHSTASVIEAWADWAVEGLHESWEMVEELLHMRPEITLPVEPKPEYSRLLGEVEFLDRSGQQLLTELNELDNYVESLSESSHSLDGDVRSRRRPSVAAFRFKGLQEIEKAHGRASQQYALASRLFRDVLDATLAAFEAKRGRSGKVVALLVPPGTGHRSILKRSASDVLAPFSTRSRSVRRQQSDDDSSKPLVPITAACYEDADSCNNATDNCSGHGSCVEGAIYGGSSDTCYVCKCQQTNNNSRTQIWTGQACQKQDYSNQFFLLAGTTVGLIVVVVASVALLTRIGDEELPPTLSAVAGMSTKHD